MKYKCQICGYIHDDDKETIPFSELPSDWKCPLCRAAKSEFKPEVPAVKAQKIEVDLASADMQKLSPGQLAAVCSNLARGCEKQYKDEESALFKELADYFQAQVPEINDATVEKLLAQLQNDVDNYPNVCNSYNEDTLYLEINAQNDSEAISTYKIPLKLENNCDK